MSIRTRKPAGASPQTPPASEQAEVEIMLRRLEELRRAASNSDLRGAYQVAVNGLDAVLYRLGMLRALEPTGPARRPASITSSAPTPKSATRLGAARKPQR